MLSGLSGVMRERGNFASGLWADGEAMNQEEIKGEKSRFEEDT